MDLLPSLDDSEHLASSGRFDGAPRTLILGANLRRTTLAPPARGFTATSLTSATTKGNDKLNPTETIIRLSDDIPWKVPDGAPARLVEEATLGGGENEDGAYLVLMKWYPGYMSAATSIGPIVSVSCSPGVVVQQRPAFRPRRGRSGDARIVRPAVAGTPHYDGAHPDATEPAVIAVSGVGPVGQTFVDPSLPPLRRDSEAVGDRIPCARRAIGARGLISPVPRRGWHSVGRRIGNDRLAETLRQRRQYGGYCVDPHARGPESRSQCAQHQGGNRGFDPFAYAQFRRAGIVRGERQLAERFGCQRGGRGTSKGPNVQARVTTPA